MRFRGLVAILAVALLVGIGVTVTLISPPDPVEPAVVEESAVAEEPTPINACDMLSEKVLEEVIGVSVHTGQRRDDGLTRDGAWSSTCFWATDEAAGQGGTYAILNAQSWPAGSGGGKQFLESFHQAAKEHVIPMQPVPLEYGDQSLWWGDGVAVLIGNISFGISVRHSSPDKSIRRPMEEKLAKKILEDLGAT